MSNDTCKTGRHRFVPRCSLCGAYLSHHILGHTQRQDARIAELEAEVERLRQGVAVEQELGNASEAKAADWRRVAEGHAKRIDRALGEAKPETACECLQVMALQGRKCWRHRVIDALTGGTGDE